VAAAAEIRPEQARRRVPLLLMVRALALLRVPLLLMVRALALLRVPARTHLRLNLLYT
jgi:hypothetical protein